MENGSLPDEEDRPGAITGPVLPPRAPAAPADLSGDAWDETRPEPPLPFVHGTVVGGERYSWLLPTTAAAVLTTVGWMGAVAAQLVLLSALVPSFDLGDTRNFVVPLDEHAWFGATTLVSGLAIYLGWLWWSVSAAFNVRRVSPLSTTPVLPFVAYVGPVVLFLLSLDESGRTEEGLVFGALALLGLGHVVVIASFRDAARRIGASSDDFSLLLWLPLAGIVYRVFVSLLVELVPSWRITGVLVALTAVGALFVAGMVVATWRATRSFERACHRLNTRNLGADLPSVDLIAAALRRVTST